MQYMHLDDEQQENSQSNKYSQGQRRKLVIWTCVCYIASLIFLWLGWLGVQWHLWIDLIAYIITALPPIACFLLGIPLFASIHNIVLKKDHQLDERQRMVRDSAFRQAFIILSYLFVVLILLDLFFGLSFLTVNIMSRTLLFFNLLLFVIGLPAVIIAWKEQKI